MRAVLQRVSRAKVEVDSQVIGKIDEGLMVLLGVGSDDRPDHVKWMADKIAGLRIFPDQADKLNLSVTDVSGEILVVSQFTLWGDCNKGKRPSFSKAASGPQAEKLYDEFVAALTDRGLKVATGRFGAMMDVHLVNQGPVTLLLDSDKKF